MPAQSGTVSRCVVLLSPAGTTCVRGCVTGVRVGTVLALGTELVPAARLSVPCRVRRMYLPAGTRVTDRWSVFYTPAPCAAIEDPARPADRRWRSSAAVGGTRV